jgi:hypothetical protein
LSILAPNLCGELKLKHPSHEIGWGVFVLWGLKMKGWLVVDLMLVCSQLYCGAVG